ncbi:MAG: hypothetical protein M0Q92_12540 [Methanoregula sp.]|nr:hypothetical protein [Methanoregula sp.]
MPPVTKPDAKALSAAFVLVFRQGRSPPSCPMPDDAGLLNRILDTAPDASPAACRDALVRVRRLSFDAEEVAGAFRQGEYGTGDEAQAAALADLEGKNPHFSETEYRTAFAVGLMWAEL